MQSSGTVADYLDLVAEPLGLTNLLLRVTLELIPNPVSRFAEIVEQLSEVSRRIRVGEGSSSCGV